MADGSLTIKLTEETSARIKAAAEEAGESTDAFADRLLSRALEDDRWAISEARIEEYERTGVAEDLAPSVARLRARAASKP